MYAGTLATFGVPGKMLFALGHFDCVVVVLEKSVMAFRR